MNDVNDRRALKEAEVAAKLAETNRLDAVRGIMSERLGRDWILGWLETCHVFQTSFRSDPMQMAFLEGERNIGLRLFNDIMQACPEEYILMMREKEEKDAARSRRRDSGPDRGDSDGDAEGPDPNFVDYGADFRAAGDQEG